MADKNTRSRLRNVVGKVFRVLAIGGALVLALAVTAHLAWKYSGSNRWELAVDKGGVQVYTLKAPGSVVERIKGVTRVRTTLNAAVDMMMQTDSKDCSEWFPGCQSVQPVKAWNPRDLTYTHLFRLAGHPPFAPREVLLKAQVTQDPGTKSVLIEFMAMPDELPQNPCCFRVSHMHNTWRYTPLDNGEVEVEVLMNVDLGVPYVLFNRLTPLVLRHLLANLQKYEDNPRWHRARYELIKEKS